MSLSLFEQASLCLQACDTAEKYRLTRQLAKAWNAGELSLDCAGQAAPIGEAGHPEKPQLVSPRKLPKRGFGSEQGRAILAHALLHIEFNAINLALDAVYRFRDMPRQFYSDWIRVADEEAVHFSLLEQYLGKRGYAYGDYEAHNGLWEMAQKTAHDVMVRMALVPRVLEARGLDVTPGIMTRLQQVGDTEFVEHLKVIQCDEIGHVAIGNHWFKYLCEQRRLEPRETFKQLINDYMKGSLKGPYDEVARKQAGFTEQEIADLKSLEL